MENSRKLKDKGEQVMQNQDPINRTECPYCHAKPLPIHLVVTRRGGGFVDENGYLKVECDDEEILAVECDKCSRELKTEIVKDWDWKE